MPEIQLIYTQEATQDMMAIADYHMKMVGIGSAERAVAKLYDHIEKLKSFPSLGEVHPDNKLSAMGFRKLVHENHIVIYRVMDEGCIVVVERIFWASANYPELLLH